MLNYFWGKSIHICILDHATEYHKLSNISLTKSQKLNISLVVLQLLLPNQLKPGVT